MQLSFFGATQTVTGSRYMLACGERRVMVDCGLFQGYKHLRLKNWARLPFAAHQVDAVLLTHAHLDHSGYLPLLVKNGFKGRIYATSATVDGELGMLGEVMPEMEDLILRVEPCHGVLLAGSEEGLGQLHGLDRPGPGATW